MNQIELTPVAGVDSSGVSSHTAMQPPGGAMPGAGELAGFNDWMRSLEVAAPDGGAGTSMADALLERSRDLVDGLSPQFDSQEFSRMSVLEQMDYMQIKMQHTYQSQIALNWMESSLKSVQKAVETTLNQK